MSEVMMSAKQVAGLNMAFRVEERNPYVSELVQANIHTQLCKEYPIAAVDEVFVDARLRHLSNEFITLLS